MQAFETYKEEIKERWGETAAYKEHTEKTKAYAKEKWATLALEMDAILASFAALMQKGEKAESPETQKLAEKLQVHITENYYLCTNEILSGLGKMYVEDERFRANINKHGAGTASFIRDAIDVYCAKG